MLRDVTVRIACLHCAMQLGKGEREWTHTKNSTDQPGPLERGTGDGHTKRGRFCDCAPLFTEVVIDGLGAGPIRTWVRAKRRNLMLLT